MFWIFSENFASKMVKSLLVNMVKRVGLWVFLLVIYYYLFLRQIAADTYLVHGYSCLSCELRQTYL